MNNLKSDLKDAGSFWLCGLMILATCAFTAFAYSAAYAKIPGTTALCGLTAVVQAFFTANGVRKQFQKMPEPDNKAMLKAAAISCGISAWITFYALPAAILLMIGAQKMIEALHGPEPGNVIVPVAMIAFTVIFMLLDSGRPEEKPVDETAEQEA